MCKQIRKEFSKELEKIECPERKCAVKKMMSELGSRFFSAPATSTASNPDRAKKGWLAKHSLNVIDKLFKLRDLLAPNAICDESIVIVGAFHDLGKIGTPQHDYYIWDCEKKEYIRNPRLRKAHVKMNAPLKMSHAQRSIYLLQHYGVKLREEEFQAILFHDGQYVPAGEEVSLGECKLTLLLHWADLWSSNIEGI